MLAAASNPAAVLGDTLGWEVLLEVTAPLSSV